jgi:hypothetical protein
VRKSGELPWLRPDCKSQVSVRYDGGRPRTVDAVVLSTQHDGAIGYGELKEAVMETIVKPVLPESMLSAETKYFVNPTGRFVIGGPVGDCGLTGRKIIVDTYGGVGRHGGGAFSGKDPSKVDRSAAYAARYVAKNLVAAGLAEKCEVQVAYAIGVAEPVSVHVETFGTAKVDEARIESLIRAHFDLRPKALSRCWISYGPSIARRPRTATSVGMSPSSPGSAPTAPMPCATLPVSHFSNLDRADLTPSREARGAGSRSCRRRSAHRYGDESTRTCRRVSWRSLRLGESHCESIRAGGPAHPRRRRLPGRRDPGVLR